MWAKTAIHFYVNLFYAINLLLLYVSSDRSVTSKDNWKRYFQQRGYMAHNKPSNYSLRYKYVTLPYNFYSATCIILAINVNMYLCYIDYICKF